MIDLGNWAAETYRVAASSPTTGEPAPDAEPDDKMP